MKNCRFAKNSRGQILDIWGAVIILITAGLMVLVMIAVFFLGTFSGKMDIEIAVERVASKPYLVGELLSHRQVGDRQLLEHATEMVVVNGPENSKSSGVKPAIEEFMELLGFKKKEEYRIVVKDNKNNYMDIGEKPEDADPASAVAATTNADISNNAVIPLLYKKDEKHPKGILGYINIITEGG